MKWDVLKTFINFSRSDCNFDARACVFAKPRHGRARDMLLITPLKRLSYKESQFLKFINDLLIILIILENHFHFWNGPIKDNIVGCWRHVGRQSD